MSNEQVLAEPSARPLWLKTNSMDSTDKPTQSPDKSPRFPPFGCDWSWPLQMSCRPRAAGGSRSPPLEYQIRPRESCCPPICLLCPLTRPLMAATLQKTFFFCSIFLSILHLPSFPLCLCSCDICWEITLLSLWLAPSFRSFYLGALICPPSPLSRPRRRRRRLASSGW